MVKCENIKTFYYPVIINVKSSEVIIWGNTILSGIIRVDDKNGNCLFQKGDCTADDIPFAIEVAKRGIQTNIFEII